LKPTFHIRGPIGPFDDPFLYLRFYYTGRAILFDLGEMGEFTPRDLLRVQDVFVSHAHMDHFSGLERLLRLHLHRTSKLNLYGPAEFLDRLEGRLSGFTWNLTHEYPLIVVGFETDGRVVRKAAFSAREGFQRRDLDVQPWKGCLLDESAFRITAGVLDHGIACLGFRLEEKFKVNINTTQLKKRGLLPGPWLTGFKDAILRDEPPLKKIRALGTSGVVESSLGDLEGIYHRSRGHIIAYIVDAADTPENEETILELARDADLLYIEAAFSKEDRTLADQRKHLTAEGAGRLAAKAGANRTRLIHLSPRYQGLEDSLVREARCGADGKTHVEAAWKEKRE
jgi:ribonuclease Z